MYSKSILPLNLDIDRSCVNFVSTMGASGSGKSLNVLLDYRLPTYFDRYTSESIRRGRTEYYLPNNVLLIKEALFWAKLN